MLEESHGSLRIETASAVTSSRVAARASASSSNVGGATTEIQVSGSMAPGGRHGGRHRRFFLWGPRGP